MFSPKWQKKVTVTTEQHHIDGFQIFMIYSMIMKIVFMTLYFLNSCLKLHSVFVSFTSLFRFLQPTTLLLQFILTASI